MPTGVELAAFGPLDLRSDPENVGLGGAIDGLNVDLDVRGTVRSRDGYTKFTPSAGASRYGRLFSSFDATSTSRLFAYQPSTAKFVTYEPTGLLTPDVSLALWQAPLSMAHYGGQGTTVATYGGSGTSSGTLVKYDTAFTYPAVGYSGVFVAVTPTDNRLALGYTTDATDGPHRVRFSDAGAPETFGANNYVELWPNDGGAIRGLFTYRNMLFAFKDRRFAVFYGTTKDAQGQPVFNYRPVDTGIGMYGWAGCASPNGVYFLGEDGIYLTTGDAPIKVSQALDPIFLDRLPATYQGHAINRFTSRTTAVMTWHNDRLYVSLPCGVTSVNNRLFVLDPQLGWLEWDIAAAGLTSWTTPTAKSSARVRDLFFSYAAGTNDVGAIGSPSTTDDGTAISARYRTGFWNPGQAGTEAWVRELLLDGSGTVTVKTAVNDAVTLGSGQAVTLGTSPAVAQGRDRRGVRGRNVSYEFSGSGPWSLSRATAMVWGQSAAGAKAS